MCLCGASYTAIVFDYGTNGLASAILDLPAKGHMGEHQAHVKNYCGGQHRGGPGRGLAKELSSGEAEPDERHEPHREPKWKYRVHASSIAGLPGANLWNCHPQTSDCQLLEYGNE
jgi:hypothetical protein